MGSILLFGQTDPGMVRKKNEDVVLLDKDMGFCLVADGIGGAFGGEIASQTFADIARHFFQNNSFSPHTISKLIKETFRAANEKILTYAQADPSNKGMGCTAELIYFSENEFTLGHLGDSRTYRLRQNKLEQLTLDHTLVQEQLDMGMITPEEALNHSFKNVISKAVGIRKESPPDVLTGKTVPGDVFLLCSDGLTNMVDDQTLKLHLSSETDIEQKAHSLIQAANTAGGKDNISVILAYIL